MTDPSFNGGLLSSLEQVVYFNMINHKNFIVDVCPENIYMFHYAMYFQKNSPFLHNFDVKISELQTNGLVNSLVQKYVQFGFMKSQKEQSSPKVLKIQHLMGSFQILFLGLSCSIVVAILECLSTRIKTLDEIFQLV